MVPVALPYLLGFAFVFFYSLAAVREREARTEVERLAAELQAANQRLREYAAQAEELATAHERNRLAREIHDGLGHYMTGIHMQIQAGRAVLDIDREAALDALEKAQALAQEGLTEVRRSISALRASPLDAQSLSQAVEALANECRTAGIETRVAVRGEAYELSPQAELTLYRVAQEGLTNVRRHAQAALAEVTLDYRDAGQVQLTVRDDGVGAEAPGGGYGLVGVRERVHLLEGQVEVETVPGKGFSLRVSIPTRHGDAAATV
jgi:signal transduction histidine kinase